MKNIKNLKLTNRILVHLIIFVLLCTINFIVFINDNIFVYYLLAIYNTLVYWISFIISDFIEKIKQLKYIKKAKEKLLKYKVKIVAITGSYGKTSCKNYIYNIIKDNYNVLMTPKSYNTLNGLLLTINKHLKPFHNILLLEIGVDEKNGMNKFIKNFDFDICAVTCIGQQHLKTFKTIENIANEKIKLLLNAKQVAVCNLDDKYINNLDIQVNSINFSCKNENSDIYVKNENLNNLNIKIFDNYYDSFTFLLGQHNISNIALAIAVSKALNIDDKTIIKKIETLKNVDHRLSLIKIGNWNIIDDAYNSNFEGFINALMVLKSFNGLKVIITPGIIEQNKNKENDIILAKKIKEVADIIILIKKPSFSHLIDNKLSFFTFNEAYTYLKKTYQNQKLALLIENDLPDIYLR